MGSELLTEFSDLAQLLVELRRGNEIAQRLSFCLDPDAIAHVVTDGVVEKFNCAFSRIWLVEPDRTALRLVASSGMYTRRDGAFARVPMGAFKVGKIAQFGTPFLSNQLAEESWVKDRDWAISQGICGFAGYPLVASGDVVGVLVVFSRKPLAKEFLEVLHSLCTTVAVALENALLYQREKEGLQKKILQLNTPTSVILSEQLATIFASTRLILMGTEQPLSLSLTHLFLRTAEALQAKPSSFCRLVYASDQLSLEVMHPCPSQALLALQTELDLTLREHAFTASCLGGSLLIHPKSELSVCQVILTVPYQSFPSSLAVEIACRFPVLQVTLIHLAHQAGLTVSRHPDPSQPLITDDKSKLDSQREVIWLQLDQHSPPKGIKACIDLSIQAPQLRSAVEAVVQGNTWGIRPVIDTQELSDREQEIMLMIGQGFRDRQIASQLHISERTVKFHLNNVVTKLNVRTRQQALYEAIKKGLLRDPE